MRSTAFPLRLFAMINEAETVGHTHILSWLPNGRGFTIHDEGLFLDEVLPRYNFKASKITSIQRNLNIYGFQRLVKGDFAGAYVHPMFHRDMDPAVLKLWVRKGPVLPPHDLASGGGGGGGSANSRGGRSGDMAAADAAAKRVAAAARPATKVPRLWGPRLAGGTESTGGACDVGEVGGAARAGDAPPLGGGSLLGLLADLAEVALRPHRDSTTTRSPADDAESDGR